MDSKTMEISISIERHQSEGYTYVDVPVNVCGLIGAVKVSEHRAEQPE